MSKDPKTHLAKYAPPPLDLPVYQQVDPRDVSFIGRTNYEAPGESVQFVFGIKRKDRTRHVYIIGKTGVGKSKLFELLIRQDIAHGHGLCLIDPDGDLVRVILDVVPEERVQDIVVIDPTDIEWPVSFNPFKGVPPQLRHQAAQGFTEIMEKQFGNQWSHRIEHVLRLSLLALLDYPEATLHGLISLLTDEQYRRKVIIHIKDDLVKRFFEYEFDDWAHKFEADGVTPIVNQITKFLAVPAIRNIFIQKENKIDFNDIIARRAVILVNLARTTVGDQNAHVLGSLILYAIRHAGMARADNTDNAAAAHKDFYLYLYEFHTMMSGSLMNLFSESRRYGFAVTVAHQYIAQLDPSVLASVLGNVGTIITFRVSGEDAEKFEGEMTPVFKAKDMINLGTREFYIKEMINGETHDPFSADTLAVLPAPYSSRKEQIIDASRTKYATTLARVKELYHRPFA